MTACVRQCRARTGAPVFARYRKPAIQDLGGQKVPAPEGQPRRRASDFKLASTDVKQKSVALPTLTYGTYGLFSPIFTTNFGRLVDWSNVVNFNRPIYEKCLKRHFKSAPLGLN